MSAKRTAFPAELPRWVVLGGSALIAFHLLALVILVLSAPSGPWPSPFGTSQAIGPAFADSIAAYTTRYYLQPLQLTHNYHFLGNRTEMPDVKFEVSLQDESGHSVATVTVPAAGTNPWLRFRHHLLAQGLGGDEPMEAPRGEMIPAPGQQMQKIKIWDSAPGSNRLEIRSVPLHLVPKDHPISRPSDWSLILARSYQRYLCRQHGAAKAELIRHSRQPLVPSLMFMPDFPPGTFDTLDSAFEGYSREK
jgi:hypothetical protein